jgi:subtilase family serine protease
MCKSQNVCALVTGTAYSIEKVLDTQIIEFAKQATNIMSTHKYGQLYVLSGSEA